MPLHCLFFVEPCLVGGGVKVVYKWQLLSAHRGCRINAKRALLGNLWLHAALYVVFFWLW